MSCSGGCDGCDAPALNLFCCLAGLLVREGWRDGTGIDWGPPAWRAISCAGDPGAGVFSGLGRRVLSACRGLSAERGGVFGSAGSGDIGLGGVCPGEIGAFWRSEADDTMGRIIPGVRFVPTFGAGSGTVLSGAGGSGIVSSSSEAVTGGVDLTCAGGTATGATRGVDTGRLGSRDVGTSSPSFARSVIAVVSFMGAGFCLSPASPVFIQVNSMVVFGITGGCAR